MYICILDAPELADSFNDSQDWWIVIFMNKLLIFVLIIVWPN